MTRIFYDRNLFMLFGVQNETSMVVELNIRHLIIRKKANMQTPNI